MPRVFNKRDPQIPPGAVYVGRPSKWGNPYPINATHTRADVIRAYHNYLTNNAKLMSELHELRGKDLVCWCAPNACHADILLRLANL
jgi:hypothetical protein